MKKTIYPSIQLKEHKNKKSINNTDEDSSSLVESSSQSEEDVIERFKKFSSQPTLSSRQAPAKEKNNAKATEVRSIPFFEHMPEDVIRKILFEQFIDLNDIPATAKNLMHFASISKFNREFIRQLLTEEGMHEVSFEITKSVIPNLLATLANDKKAQFTDADIDELVHNWPYLTFDSSYPKNKILTNNSIEAIRNIVGHPELKEIKIINKMYFVYNYKEWNENEQTFNNNGLELLYSLLSRNNSDSLKIDFNFHGWIPPINYLFQIEDKSFDLIKKIQERAEGCASVSFGKLDLSRIEIRSKILFKNTNPLSFINRDYQFKFVKMMCNVALSHSAHTISLAGLKLLDEELALIINEIQRCDKSSLQHLNLSGNFFEKLSVDSLSKLLQSEITCIKTIDLSRTWMDEDKIDVLSETLKNNHSLELIVIDDEYLPVDHPINEDKRLQVNRLPAIPGNSNKFWYMQG